jgi:hypothetical protein
MKNAQVINIINGINSNPEILRKRLPIKLLFAFKKNVAKLNAAVGIYRETLTTICEHHGTSPDEISGTAAPELLSEIGALLEEEADATFSKVPSSVLDACGDNYDALTYAELAALEFMLEVEDA